MGNVVSSCLGGSTTTAAANHLVLGFDDDNIDNDILTPEMVDVIYDKTKQFPEQTQVAIAIIQNGKVHFCGVKRSVHDEIVWTDNRDSVFEIGSITKVFTSTLLAQLVIDGGGKINLEETTMNELLPNVVPFNNDIQIPILSLANHTSGLPRLPTNMRESMRKDQKNPYKNYSVDDLNHYLTKELKVKKSDKNYVYSNLGAGLLGHGLSVSQDITYEELLQTLIFNKYDMNQSTTDRNKIQDNKLVSGRDRQRGETPNWDLSVLVGAGGILSTMQDLATFALAQFDTDNKALALTRQQTHEILPRSKGGWKAGLQDWLVKVLVTGDEALAKLMNHQIDSIGLGWHIVHTDNNDEWHWHNGGTGGYRCSMGLDVSRQNGVIILSNLSAFHGKSFNVDALCFRLLDLLKRIEVRTQEG